jgi:hypothetical protein
MKIDPVSDIDGDPVPFHVRDGRQACDRARFAGAMKLIVLAPGLREGQRPPKVPVP